MDENIALARRFVQDHFVSKGMIADLAVHEPDKENGISNPHFHVLTTMRPLNPDGTWGNKQRREYVLDENGERKKDENGNYIFVAVHTTDWLERETLDHWREAWRHMVNAEFERKGIAARIDHRSYEAQGIEQIPTVHEGPLVQKMEQQGVMFIAHRTFCSRAGSERDAAPARFRCNQDSIVHTANFAYEEAVDIDPNHGFAINDFLLMRDCFLNQHAQEFFSQFGDVRLLLRQSGKVLCVTVLPCEVGKQGMDFIVLCKIVLYNFTNTVDDIQNENVIVRFFSILVSVKRSMTGAYLCENARTADGPGVRPAERTYGTAPCMCAIQMVFFVRPL